MYILDSLNAKEDYVHHNLARVRTKQPQDYLTMEEEKVCHEGSNVPGANIKSELSQDREIYFNLWLLTLAPIKKNFTDIN